MHILNERMTVNHRSDPAIVTVTFTVILNDGDVERAVGFIERVTLDPAPLPASYIGPSVDITLPLPQEEAVRPQPSATWRELHREHVFQVPRHPKGTWNNVRFRAIINIRPGLTLSAKKITGEGELPARYTVSTAVREIGTTIGKLLGR